MAALSIQVPYPVFYDRDGQPLDNGNIYIGVANLDPVTNPLQVYYDESLTITASQPLVTSGGYVYRNGTPTQLYVNALDFSITVNDSKNLLVYNFPEGTGLGVGAATIEYNPPFAGAVTSGYTVADKLSQTVSVQDFGAVGDGVADDTAAIQAALDSGLPFTMPWGDYLVTDSLEIDETVGCTIIGEARTVPNTSTFPRIIFQPATKRDAFVWKNLPASYAFAAVTISGLAFRGEGPGAGAVFNLPRLYRGNIDAYIFTGIDYFAIVERWLDCNVTGNINGFRTAAFKIKNSTLSGGNITTRTEFDVYISGGDPAFTTYGYDIDTFSIIGGRITNIVESVECAVRMAVGNTLDSTIYAENIPRTNTGAMFEIGKINTGSPDGTTVFNHSGVTLHGMNTASPGYNATIFADIDRCSSFSIIGADIKRFGGLLKTTANSKNVSFIDTFTVGVELLELTTSDIADLAELSFFNFRPVGMSSPHGNAFQNTNVMTTSARNPTGLTRPRWAYDRIYSTSSLSFWLSIGDGLEDWRLMAPKVYSGSLVIGPGIIAAGASYQTNITVTGASVGDFAVAGYATLIPELVISARVSATDTVTVTLTNVSGAPVNGGSAVTMKTVVTKAVV